MALLDMMLLKQEDESKRREARASHLQAILSQHNSRDRKIYRKGLVLGASEIYEDGCTNLLVKALYNKGLGARISLRWREFNQKGQNKVIRDKVGKTYTPDFVAVITVTADSKFAPCLVDLQGGIKPMTQSVEELDTPPSSPDKARSGAKAEREGEGGKYNAVFEYALDSTKGKWKQKMKQLETYVVCLGGHDKIEIAGLAFPSDQKWRAVAAIAQSDTFPELKKLYDRGRFLFLLSNEDMVSVMQESVVSGRSLSRVVMALCEIVINDVSI